MIGTSRLQEITDDPDLRARLYREMVQSHYASISRAYRSVWGESMHFAIFGQGESLDEAIVATERFLARDGQFRTNQLVLDVGCGVGGPALTIATASGAGIVGVDILDQHVVVARRRAIERGLSGQVSFVCADIMQLPFENESFDHAYLFESGCHAPSKERLCAEIARVLRPGGLFLGLDWMRADGLTREEEIRFLEPVCRFFALPGLASPDAFSSHLRKSGFQVEEMRNAAELGDVVRNWDALEPARVARLEAIAGDLPRLALGGKALGTAARQGVFILGYWRARKTPGAERNAVRA